MSLILLASIPFFGAMLVVSLARFGRTTAAFGAGLSTLTALLGLIWHIPDIARGKVVLARLEWLPRAGLNAHFMLDGLGLLFGLLILGVGLLVVVYARFYLAKNDDFPQFYSTLLAFQGAMLGIVLSDNILLLLMFWEVTSITSFLLIGYWSHDRAARQGARMALAITGAGGLALFAGLLLLGQIAGSYDLSQILDQRSAVQSSPLYVPMLGLIVLGAFAKSAQFPFHVWLPHAMAAPTPVSAYLHSATMVKAGIFLLARLWPVLSGSEAWFYLLVTTGLLTMLLGAKIALFKDDLKAILAYSTISHLGLITMLLGLGTKAGAVAAMLHILAHASFKAPLFMLAGIVDHAAHTRDLRSLGGLRRVMPITFALAMLSGLSMAGVPPLLGFLSKEMALDVAAHTTWAGVDWLVPALSLIGAAMSIAYSLRFLGGVFFGARPDALAQVREAGPGLWLAPMVLVMATVLLGLAPMTLAAGLVALASSAVTGTAADIQINHWHGLASPALWMSLAALAMAALVLLRYDALRRIWDIAMPPDGKAAFDALLAAKTEIARRTVLPLYDGAASRSIAIAVAVILALAGYAFWGGTLPAASRGMLPISGVAITLTLLLLAALGMALMWRQSRVLALLLVGVIGLIIAAGFALLSAPDLAMTQITVEVVTVILMLLALRHLPQTSAHEAGVLKRWGGAILAALAGLGTSALAYGLMIRNAAFPPISAFHLAQSKPGAGGTNAVNTIIVDFRGYDTYGEIIVLGIAALIIAASVQGLVQGPTSAQNLAGGPQDVQPHRAADGPAMMMQVASRLLLPMGLLIGVYLFLRGHNLPGGGFVAGLVVAIVLLLRFIADGAGGAQAAALRFIGAGVLIASATGLGSLGAGRPFLTSNYGYFDLWPLEKIELATATLFDLGVFCCVLGAVMLALTSLARLPKRAP